MNAQLDRVAVHLTLIILQQRYREERDPAKRAVLLTEIEAVRQRLAELDARR